MGDQVVPGLPGKSFVPASRNQVPRLRSKKIALKTDVAKDSAVPGLRAPKRLKTEAIINELSPAAEYKGKVRWATPLRVGKWVERWESAREMSKHVAVRSRERLDVANAVRSIVAEAVVEKVGGTLMVATVTKWLCLLFDYLELNEDEQVLVVCLLRKYVHAGGKFVGVGDWARPQRWECVVAISCYFAVLLTEEFPGRTSLDLRELLGPNFRFGFEQVSFLKLVDWRISVDDISFREAKESCIKVANCIAGEREKMMESFRHTSKAPVKVAPKPIAVSPTPTTPPLVVPQQKESPPAFVHAAPQMKKRPYAAIAPGDDSMVPLSFVATVVPTMPQSWVPRGW